MCVRARKREGFLCKNKSCFCALCVTLRMRRKFPVFFFVFFLVVVMVTVGGCLMVSLLSLVCCDCCLARCFRILHYIVAKMGIPFVLCDNKQ